MAPIAGARLSHSVQRREEVYDGERLVTGKTQVGTEDTRHRSAEGSEPELRAVDRALNFNVSGWSLSRT